MISATRRGTRGAASDTGDHPTARGHEDGGAQGDPSRHGADGHGASLPYDEGKDVTRVAGDKVSLLIPREDDEAARTYLRWISDKRIAKWIRQSEVTGGMEAEREWIRKVSSDPGNHTYNILDMERMRIVGNCSIRMRGSTAVLGILIGDPESRCRGLGTAAMGMLVRRSFDDLGAHRVELSVMGDNERAIRCYMKAGFSECGRRHEECWYDGAWHDSIIMEVLRGQWEASRR